MMVEILYVFPKHFLVKNCTSNLDDLYCVEFKKKKRKKKEKTV